MAKQAKVRLSLRRLSGVAQPDELHTRVMRDVPGMAELGHLLPGAQLADTVLLRSNATLPRGDGTKQPAWSDHRISAPPRNNCRYRSPSSLRWPTSMPPSALQPPTMARCAAGEGCTHVEGVPHFSPSIERIGHSATSEQFAMCWLPLRW